MERNCTVKPIIFNFSIFYLRISAPSGCLDSFKMYSSISKRAELLWDLTTCNQGHQKTTFVCNTISRWRCLLDKLDGWVIEKFVFGSWNRCRIIGLVNPAASLVPRDIFPHTNYSYAMSPHLVALHGKALRNLSVLTRPNSYCIDYGWIICLLCASFSYEVSRAKDYAVNSAALLSHTAGTCSTNNSTRHLVIELLSTE